MGGKTYIMIALLALLVGTTVTNSQLIRRHEIVTEVTYINVIFLFGHKSVMNDETSEHGFCCHNSRLIISRYSNCVFCEMISDE